MSYYLSGASGASLPLSLHDLPGLNIDSWGLRFESLGMDTLYWTAETTNASGGGTIIPDPGQIVELWEGAWTRRVFRGHCAIPRVGRKSAKVQVLGPWWWMGRFLLSGDVVDSTGATADRASYVFPKQGLKESILSLLGRAIAQGVPMQIGNISDMFTVPKITLSNMNFQQALAELLRWMPDAVVRFDYSDIPAKIHVTRRGDMTGLTWTVGTEKVEDWEIHPRLDLEVSQVQLHYVTREASTGKPKWASQNNGTWAPGKRQIVTVSGPEIADYLPKDDFDKVWLRTIAWNSVSDAYISSKDPTLAAIKAEYGSIMGGSGSYVAWYDGWSKGKYYSRIEVPGLRRKSETGASIPSGTDHLVISDQALPEWAQKLLGAIQVTITGTWIAGWRDSEFGAGTAWNGLFRALRAGAETIDNKWQNGTHEPGTDWDHRVDWAFRPFSFQGWLINQDWATAGWFYKPMEYDYATPPASLAENLKLTQNWIPYEGHVDLVGDEIEGVNYLGRKFNLAGAYGPHASMNALLKAVDYDGGRVRTVLELGAPPRLDMGSLVERIRGNPKDNIVYL